MIAIRQEELNDSDAIRHLNLVAFENGPEAKLVDKLRDCCEEYLV